MLNTSDDLFAGGGTMGRLTRAFDWSATPLGPPAQWPTSLRAPVRILLTSRFAMWMGWGPDLTFFYNDAYGEMTLGAKHPWALGRPAREVWAEIWDDIGPRIKTVLQTGTATWDEGLRLFLQRSGYPEETYHTFSYSPLADDQGRVVGMLCVVVEETDRIIGERRLRTLGDLGARARETREATEACQVAAQALAGNPADVPFALIYLLDETGTEARLVAAAGVPAGHPVLAPVVALASTPEERLEGPAALPFDRVADTRRSEIVDRVARRLGRLPGGPWPDAAARAVVLPLEAPGQPRLAGFLVVGANSRRPLDAAYLSFFDLVAGHVASAIADATAYETERRRAEALAELDRAKTAFFSNVSHEFRTPLTLQLGPLEDVLDDGGLPVAHRERLETAHRNSLRLLRLVNTLLDFSRIESGRAQASFEPTDLSALTADLASTFRSAIERAGLALVVDCPPLPAPVYVDREMWEKVVLNLLSNAFKFTFNGGVRVALAANDGAVHLAVADSGTGIPAAELPHLFERFHRVRGAHGRSFEGTGIGLALVKELVRLHGGSIDVTSEIGQGTAFTVTLPLGAAHLPPAQVVDAATSSARPGSRIVAPFVEEALRWLPAMAANARPAEGAQAEAGTEGWILVADDNADLREYLLRILGGRWTVTAVGNGEAALDAMRDRLPDLVLSDVMMPRLDGFGLLAAIRADDRLRELPVVLLSARAGEEARLEGLGAGADDYLVKPFSARELVARVESSLALSRVRREAGEALRRREQQFASLAENLPDLVARYDRQLRRTYVNRAITELTGQGAEDIVEQRPNDSEGPPDLVRRWLETVRGVFESGVPAELEFEYPTADGPRTFDTRFVAERDGDGTVASVVCIARDVTAQRQSEERLRQAAKMEAIGRLAGGIAHDFNNQLQGVAGFAAFVARDQGLGVKARHDLDEVRKAAERMAGLTRQLLAFSRQQVLTPETLDLNAAVTDGRALLQRLIGSDVEMRLELAPAPLWVRVDRAQLLQVLMNLAINARDAMPAGGQVALSTGLHVVTPADRPDGSALPVEPGRYAALAVTDTGTGIAPDHLPHIFEPFFTTKEVGKGTGLGLATVQGIVIQSGGHLWAASEQGRGATFTILLPLVDAPPDAGSHTAAEVAPASRQACVLVVDDEEVVRAIMARTLEEEGYVVLQARNGREALERLAGADGHLDLVLSDVVMPLMGGRELGTRLAAEHPDLPVIWMSGYPRDAVSDERPGQIFLQKPIPPEVLAATVRELLAATPRR